MRIARAFAALAVAFLAGCASLPGADSEAEACRRWYASLDDAVEAQGVRDGQQARVRGFPYLRVDRLHAALKDRAAAGESAFQAYADALLELDLRARRHEIRNVRHPPMPAREMYARTAACGRLLRDLDLASPAARAELLEAARVPPDYSDASRALGLYALTRFIFARGVRAWEAETAARFASEPATPDGAIVVRHGPPGGPKATRAEVARILSRNRDPLGRLQLSDAELRRIAAAYAPTFEVVVRGDYDRFGALRWLRGSETPAVDAARGVVYLAAAQTRYRRGTADYLLLQLVYTLWFAERPPLEEADPYAGRLDGLVWRVTLAPDGEPLVYDSIHPCGCYHQFFPTPRAHPRPAPDALEEWAFVPRSLPPVREGERPRVRLASATHFIEQVGIERSADTVVRYAFEDYDELRSLRRLDGGFRSAFGPDGLIAGTERGERLYFWPMGIASAGAMRQWGRQPTAFVGRRHFDDADLLERRFGLDLGAAR